MEAIRGEKVTERAEQVGQAGMVLHLPKLVQTFRTAGRLVVEGIAVPYLLVAILLSRAGLTVALLSALAWSWAIVGLRWKKGRVPGMLLLSGGLLTARVAVSLLSGSAFVYLLQPVLGSLVMAGIFAGSSAMGKPITLTLAKDFLHLPEHMLTRPRVQRMFRHVGFLWGAGRVLDAGVSFLFLHHGVHSALMGRMLFSPLLLAGSIGACFYLGRRALAKDDIRLALSR